MEDERAWELRGTLFAVCLPSVLGTLVFLASAYGPLLLPLAAAVVWAERRLTRASDPIAVATLALAVVAAIATHGWVLETVEWP